MKVAIYTRVSTGKQDTENQAAAVREFAAKLGWTVCHEFIDAVTGTKSENDRPHFKRMFELAARRKFDLWLFWALDRFSRESVLPTLHHLQRLDSYGVWRSFAEQHLYSTGIFMDAVISITSADLSESRQGWQGLSGREPALEGRECRIVKLVGPHCGGENAERFWVK